MLKFRAEGPSLKRKAENTNTVLSLQEPPRSERLASPKNPPLIASHQVYALPIHPTLMQNAIS